MAGGPAYHLLACIGQGQSGRVFRARDAEGREIAVKVIEGDEAARPDLLVRLAAEVTLSKQLADDGLVRLLDSGLLDGRPFLAMELVDGPDLSSLMAAGPVPLQRTLGIVAGVAVTLARIHAAGAVHRDVKPGNIKLRGGIRPVLMDMGVAAITAADRRTGNDLVGSPAYLAPEIIADRPFDGRADVFALGVILYMLLARRRPFGGTADEAMDAIRSVEPPSPSALDPNLPHSLDMIVARALAKDPAERFTAAALAEALRAL